MAQETFVLGIYMYIYIPLYTLDMGLNIWVTGIPSTNLAVLQGEKKRGALSDLDRALATRESPSFSSEPPTCRGGNDPQGS